MIKVKKEVLDRTVHRSRPSPSMEALMEDLTSPDGGVREEARKTIAAHGTAGIKPLIRLLSSQDAQTRWEAAKALAEVRHRDAAAALASCLGDEHRDVRWVAAEGLIAIGREALPPVLERLMAHADSVWVREEAEHILHNLSEDNPTLQPVLKALTGRAPLFEVPVAAFDALKELKNRGITS